MFGVLQHVWAVWGELSQDGQDFATVCVYSNSNDCLGVGTCGNTACRESHKFIVQKVVLTYHLVLHCLNDFRRKGIGVT
jgi:hypothetical protein